jgi:hypothetical protein
MSGTANNNSPSNASIEPITDVAVYRATLQACVLAEGNDQRKLARTLRVWIDASPFGGCPMCDGRPTWRNEPACVTCHGEGFVPESISTPFLSGQAARQKGVDLTHSSVYLLSPIDKRYNDFMDGYNSSKAVGRVETCA